MCFECIAIGCFIVSFLLIGVLFLMSDDKKEIIQGIKENRKVSIVVGMIFIAFLIYATWQLTIVMRATG